MSRLQTCYTQHSRTSHQCVECGREIAKGDRVFRAQRSTRNGYEPTIWTCEHCRSLDALIDSGERSGRVAQCLLWRDNQWRDSRGQVAPVEAYGIPSAWPDVPARLRCESCGTFLPVGAEPVESGRYLCVTDDAAERYVRALLEDVESGDA